MKKTMVVLAGAALISSCSLFKKSEKTGCPTNGANVGAEKLLSGDPKYSKEVKAATKSKYKGKKSY